MVTWIIRTQTNDYKRALETAEDLRNRGYEVWIEEENGQHVDEQSLNKKRQTNRLREIGEGALIWLGAITVGIVGLYLLGAWVDRTW
jgi:hypothetical protein